MSGQVDRMEISAFRRLLDVHGSDMARWPEEARVQAQALLLSDARARRLLAEARALEDLLRADAPPPEGDLAQRIMARVMAGDAVQQGGEMTQGRQPVSVRRVRDHRRRRMMTPWWAAAPLAASLLLGVWLGLSGALAPVEQVLLADAADDLAFIMEVAAPAEETEGELL